ncbi:MAG: M81 family metallopeptidase, partial [Gammaproteobacteria bacterium]|nr:M81 family metallopeptidase [Gammaproteobacteria bacterium]
MRIGIAMMSHETNTFSPVVTDLARFSGGHEHPRGGSAAVATYRGTASCLGGYIKVCEELGMEINMSIAAGASPSGPVEDDAFEYMCQQIVAVAQDCDALLLDLHGAMVTKSFDDGEGELLTRIRAVAPDLPIAVSLDMHANVTNAIVGNA